MVNEGDFWDYEGFEDEVWVEDVKFDFIVFFDVMLKEVEEFGCFKIVMMLGDIDGDGDYD